MTALRKQSRWGTGVLASFALFIVGILVMAWISMAERIDLVADRYYDQGLRYQERITAGRNSANAGGVRIAAVSGAVLLEFPASAHPGTGSGKISFYRPSDERRDFTVHLAVDSLGSQRVSTASLERGLWRVRAEWTVDGMAHYHEEPVVIR